MNAGVPGDHGAPPPPDRERRVAVVLHQLAHQPWSEQFRRDMEQELSARGVALEFPDAHGSAGEQLQHLRRCLAERFDAVVVLPIDAGAVQALLSERGAARVPVVVVGDGLDAEDVCVTQIVADNEGYGREVARFFVEAMRGRGDVVEVRGARMRASLDRSRGFQAELATAPGVRIVDACAGDWTYRGAAEAFSRVLARNVPIHGVFAHNDEMALAVLDEAAKVGRERELLVAGIDALPSSIKLVREGRLAITFLSPSPAREACQALLATFAGEPCLPRVVLRTWPFCSHERVRAWREVWRRDRA